MSEIYDDLMQIITEAEQSSPRIPNSEIKVNDGIYILPCNEKKELVGLDYEVLNFHLQKQGLTVIKTEFLQVENYGDCYVMPKPKVNLFDQKFRWGWKW